MIPPKMEKMMKVQGIGALVIGALASIIAIKVCVSMFGISVTAFIVGGLLAYSAMRLGVLIFDNICYSLFYKGNHTQMHADATIAKAYFRSKISGVNVEPIATTTIVNLPEKTLATFKDVAFYEWMDVIDQNGNNVRLKYYGCIEIGKSNIPPGCIMIEPGILYQVDTAVNKAT